MKCREEKPMVDRYDETGKAAERLEKEHAAEIRARRNPTRTEQLRDDEMSDDDEAVFDAQTGKRIN
jgi:hypothetical protein